MLDDLDDFEDDPTVDEKLGGLATSKTIGNYLRAMAILIRPDKPHFAKKLRTEKTKIQINRRDDAGLF